MKNQSSKSSGSKAGNRVLFQVVTLVVVVFVVSSIVSFLFFRNSQKRLIQKSKDKLVEYKVDLITGPSKYLTNLINKIQLLSIPGSTPQSIQDDLATGIREQEVTPSQKLVDDIMKEMVVSGLFSYGLALYALPPEPGLNTKPVIVISSDEKYTYQELPETLTGLIEMSEKDNTKDRARVNDLNSYMLALDGMPELGLDGEYLITAFKYEPESVTGETWYYTFTSMHKELAAIDTFYNKEQRRINLVLILVLVASILALIVLTFFVLRHLIRKRITRPIDELSAAAAKVVEGDVDVQVPVTPGEEFEGLKNAFNEMLSTLRMVIQKAVGGDIEPGEPKNSDSSLKGSAASTRKRGRSSILIRITVFVVILFIIAGGLMLLFFQRSQSRLITKSREKIIQSEGETICSGHYNVSSLITRYYMLLQPEALSVESGQEFFKTLMNKQPGPVQETMSGILTDLQSKGLHGIEAAFDAMPPLAGLNNEPIIFAASDPKYVYKDLPQELFDLFKMNSSANTPYRARVDKYNTYMLFEDGIPGLGFKGPYLVTTYNHRISSESDFGFWFYSFKPMQKELAAINSFSSKESRRTLVIMGIVQVVSIVVVIIITFFVLSFLIRNNITKPVDELAAAAEQVMEGDLDIRVPVRKSEEFEDLKNAFNSMLGSLNEIIEKGMKG